MPIDPEILPVFLAACLAINISPGPSIVYVSTLSISRGVRVGIASAIGLNLGILVHVLAAALGVSAILAESATAFTIVKYIGAGYLVYLGVRMLLNRAQLESSAPEPGQKSLLAILFQSALVDLLNPKIALFFLAFLPQFVRPDMGHAFAQVLVLGSLFIVTGTIVNVLIAVVTARTARRVRFAKLEWLIRWLPGCILVGLGVRLATLER